MNKKEILKLTNKSGAYEFGRRKGYRYGFDQGTKAGVRAEIEANIKYKNNSKRLKEIMSSVQDVLLDSIIPDSKLTNDDTINNILGLVDNAEIVNLMKEL